MGLNVLPRTLRVYATKMENEKGEKWLMLEYLADRYRHDHPSIDLE